MNKLHKLFSFVIVLIFSITSFAYADEVISTAQTQIKISLKQDDTNFFVESFNAATVPIPVQNLQGVDPFIALTGVVIGYMTADKISQTAEQMEQKKKIPQLLKLAKTVQPSLLIKNQLSSELEKHSKWTDGRLYELDIEPEYYLSPSLHTMKMVFKYRLKASKPKTKSESTKSQIYIFHNLEQDTNLDQLITWNEINEEKLTSTFIQSAGFVTDCLSNIDIHQVPNSDFVIATTVNDEKLRGYVIKQENEWVWLLDQNKNIYILKPKRTFVLKPHQS